MMQPPVASQPPTKVVIKAGGRESTHYQDQAHPVVRYSAHAPPAAYAYPQPYMVPAYPLVYGYPVPRAPVYYPAYHPPAPPPPQPMMPAAAHPLATPVSMSDQSLALPPALPTTQPLSTSPRIAAQQLRQHLISCSPALASQPLATTPQPLSNRTSEQQQQQPQQQQQQVQYIRKGNKLVRADLVNGKPAPIITSPSPSAPPTTLKSPTPPTMMPSPTSTTTAPVAVATSSSSPMSPPPTSSSSTGGAAQPPAGYLRTAAGKLVRTEVLLEQSKQKVAEMAANRRKRTKATGTVLKGKLVHLNGAVYVRNAATGALARLQPGTRYIRRGPHGEHMAVTVGANGDLSSSQVRVTRSGHMQLTTTAGASAAQQAAQLRHELRTKRKLAAIQARAARKQHKIVYCKYYHRFGKCAKQGQPGGCRFVHDAKRVALCRLKLFGTQHDEQACPYNHDITEYNAPMCSFFQKNGACHRQDCHFAHVKVADNAKVCADFLAGFCPRGFACTQRHVYECPKGAACARWNCAWDHPPERVVPERPPPPHKRQRLNDDLDLTFRTKDEYLEFEDSSDEEPSDQEGEDFHSDESDVDLVWIEGDEEDPAVILADQEDARGGDHPDTSDHDGDVVIVIDSDDDDDDEEDEEHPNEDPESHHLTTDASAPGIHEPAVNSDQEADNEAAIKAMISQLEREVLAQNAADHPNNNTSKLALKASQSEFIALESSSDEDDD